MFNSIRRSLLPSLHWSIDDVLGGYAMSSTTEDEYVATVKCSEAKLEEILDEEFGFSRNLVSSLKIRVDGNVSDGSWVWRESLLADHQLHIVLHEVETGVDIYAHWEHSWITHPLGHYRGIEYSAEKGVEMVRERLSSYQGDELPGGVPYKVESRYRREGVWHLYLVQFVSDTAATVVEKLSRKLRLAVNGEDAPNVDESLKTVGLR